MDENRESQELAIPGKIVKRNTGIKSRVQNILRRPAVQAITKAPTEQTSPVEQTPGEMSVERASEILEYIVKIPESGLDVHERNLTPQEQFKRFGGIHYADIKKAFGVYADHLLTTHGAKKPHEAYKHRLLKEDLPGPPLILYGEGPQEVYYDLELAVLLERDFKKPIAPNAVGLKLHVGKRHGMVFPYDRGAIAVESRIPLVDVKPGSSDEKERGFYDNLSLNRLIRPELKTRIPEEASLRGMRLFANTTNPVVDIERFHREYKSLWKGMRWTAANLLHWNEKRIVYPDDLDKSPSPLDKGQAQLIKPNLELPPKP